MASPRRPAVLLLLLTLCSRPGLACTLVEIAPEEQFRQATTVVLADPVAEEFTPPEAADDDYDGEATETIEWQTLVSWKGAWRADSEFTTSRTDPVFSDGPCGRSWRPGQLHGKGPWLLFLHGEEPFARFAAYPLRGSGRFFKFLERRATAKATD
jgi:hypothetical protein